MTLEEYENTQKKETKKEVGQTVKSVAPRPDKPKVKYVFFHPDNSENERINGTYKVLKGSDIVELKIIDGIITTYDEEIKQTLVTQGMIYIKSEV